MCVTATKMLKCWNRKLPLEYTPGWGLEGPMTSSLQALMLFHYSLLSFYLKGFYLTGGKTWVSVFLVLTLVVFFPGKKRTFGPTTLTTSDLTPGGTVWQVTWARTCWSHLWRSHTHTYNTNCCVTPIFSNASAESYRPGPLSPYFCRSKSWLVLSCFMRLKEKTPQNCHKLIYMLQKIHLYNMPFLMVNLEKDTWSMQLVIFLASGLAGWFIKPWSDMSTLSSQPFPWLTRIITSQRGSQTAQWM